MWRKGVLALVSTVVAIVVVPTASADKPVKTPVGPLPPITGAFCPGFEVGLEPTTNKEVEKTFSNGRTIITGAFKVDATNVATEKTISVNASGPAFVTADRRTVTARGRTFLFGVAGELGPGSAPMVLLVSGVVTLSLDEEGRVLAFTVEHGHVRDLCAELAAS